MKGKTRIRLHICLKFANRRSIGIRIQSRYICIVGTSFLLRKRDQFQLLEFNHSILEILSHRCTTLYSIKPS